MRLAKNTSQACKEAVCAVLNVQVVEEMGDYLGMPTSLGRNKSSAFEFLKHRVKKSLTGWKEKTLSRGGGNIDKRSDPGYPFLCYGGF